MPGLTVDAWARSRKEIVLVKSLKTIPVFDWATPFLGLRQPYHYHLKSGAVGEASSQRSCDISGNHVSTFDRVQYTKLESHCWTVAAQVHHADDSFYVLTRKSDSTDVKIIVGLTKIELLSGNQLLVS